MQLITHLGFSGNCEEAFNFYAKVLKGNLAFMMRYGESPMADKTPPAWQNKIMHARLIVGEAALMGADAPPDHFSKPQGFTVSIGLKEQAEAERIFAALSEGGSVQMPIQETFWAVRFGMTVDRFGIPWMINCEKPMG